MDTPDRIDGPLPSRQVYVPPAAQTFDFEDDHAADAAPSSKKLSARLVWRAFQRHWWQALFLWIAGSAALMVLSYHGIKPIYEAVAQFRIEPGEQALFARNVGLVDFAQYRESQLAIVLSPPVLSLAIADYPELLSYPRLAQALDPEAEIRHVVRPFLVRNTNQITVTMTSTSPQEAADIVNAVVKSYIKFAGDIHNQETKRRIEKLREVETQALNDVNAKRHELEVCLEKLGDKSGMLTKEGRFSASEYDEWRRQLVNIEVNKLAAQANVDKMRTLRSEFARSMDPEQLRRAATPLFHADPRVARVLDDYQTAKTKHENAKRVSRDHTNDAASKRWRKQIDDSRAKLNELWEELWPSIRERLNNGGDANADREVRDAETRLSDLVAREAILREKLKEITIRNEAAGGDALKAEFARSDMANSEAVLRQVQATLKQQEFEAKGTIAKASLDFGAVPSFRPSSNHRVKAIAAAPVAVWLGVMGLLVMLEFRSGRVADPDELSSRSRLQVLGVVPPLPPAQPTAGLSLGRGKYRAQRQLEAFVQSLDHLRVALCSRPDPWGRDRHCVLITSACGSEGKTTLAAQLAERCVNAGLMTLLIDADLRNPTLTRMLDAVDQPGLINVLRGETTPEAAMMVVHDAGGFHFLASGGPRVDPSRLLQNDRLGHLIAQARESFDMIIVDAPPVLPVPDALTIGRWTDGAVLAVRYDSSRFPLVDRANRRLAQVGVPVLGAVVSGVRSSQAAYGDSYAYGYGGSSPVKSS